MSQTQRPRFDAVGFGALNMDCLYRVDRIVVDGETVIRESRQTPGGSAANTIYGLAKLGLKTGFVGAVGDDAIGRAMIDEFAGLGADTTRIKIKPGSPSGAVFGLTDAQGHRSLYILPGANSRLNAADINMAYFSQLRLLHISSFVDEAQFRLSLDIVNGLASNVMLSFSPGALYAEKGIDAIAPILARTDILLVNWEELETVTGLTDVRGVSACRAAGCRTVVLTLGAGRSINRGNAKATPTVAYVSDANSNFFVEPIPALHPVADTVGAGDAFAAGYLHGILTGKPPETCGRIGAIVAAFSVRGIGARAGLPTLAELSARYRGLYGKDL